MGIGGQREGATPYDKHIGSGGMGWETILTGCECFSLALNTLGAKKEVGGRLAMVKMARQMMIITIKKDSARDCVPH